MVEEIKKLKEMKIPWKEIAFLFGGITIGLLI